MAPDLYIPSCIREPAHPFHPPPLGKPLRIQIEGPLVSVKKLLPDTPWHVRYIPTSFPQPAGPLLARLTYEKIYGHPVRRDVEGDLVVRDEYLGWVREVRPRNEIDYYGVTFDHLVPADDPNPEVLQININEMDDDEGAYANKYLPFAVDWREFTGKRILAVPRCCQLRKGTTDQLRINDGVHRRDRRKEEEEEALGGDELQESEAVAEA
ncbi:hypothetical protein JDV02_009428 [Purpureocillium takamizusanense]|uniref:Uncharacterized protein n=1 Tax=Purpureocillium takamizusanense TaxID=2060973 RepID=A0A9Q8QM06_9HYPO|nr:uncharacterized protein JDV02_009428 [Purpureocillium takamizusanense]UNI23619.1 hypothetical protein JDV02_009428 [Purpureocillium takamizusanense]